MQRLFFAMATIVVVGSALPAPCAAQSIGSFVSGERPMYLEIDRLVASLPFLIVVRNLPDGSGIPLLFYSAKVSPIDLSPLGIPGVLGPDLHHGGWILLQGKESRGILSPALVGLTLYLQALVETPSGWRLTSMVTVHPRDQDYREDDDPGVQFPLPLITQEIRPAGRAGIARDHDHVRVGIPLPRSAVKENGGVPALTLRGPVDRAQFSTLSSWSDGSVQWALVEYFADVEAGKSHQSVSVDHGNGNSGGNNLASVEGSEVAVDAGRITFRIKKDVRRLFQNLRLDGKALIDIDKYNGFSFVDDQKKYWNVHKQGVAIRRNGPVRCEIQVDFVLTRTESYDDPDRVYLRVFVEAFSDEPSVRIQVSLRNSSIQFPEHLLFRCLRYSFGLADPSNLSVRMSGVSVNGASPTVISGKLGAAEIASFEEGFVNHGGYSLCTDPELSLYKGFVERFGRENYAIEGARIRIGGQYFTGNSGSRWFSMQEEFANPVYLEILSAATNRGVLIVPEHGPQIWPIALAADGSGGCSVELFPLKEGNDSHSYPLTYATSETRVFHLVGESSPASDPDREAQKLDFPLFARGDLWVYNQARVWPWRLVTPDEALQFSRHAGLDDPEEEWSDPSRTIFRFAGETGGSNNNWGETRKFFEWLRYGHGGAWMWARHEAFYKVDKMPWTFDDGSVSQRQEIQNKDAPVTSKNDFYDGSKHTFAQVVPDVAFTRGETYLLDSTRHFAETFLDRELTNVHPDGNFVAGYYGAVGNSSLAVLEMQPFPRLQDNLLSYSEQWLNIVFKQPNAYNVDTYTKGWQAPLGTTVDTQANPDAYFVSKAGGKGGDFNQYGYTVQIWSAARHMSNFYLNLIHYLEQRAPNHPLILQARGRGPDIYHFLHRPFIDDHSKETGHPFLLDLFDGDAGNEDVDPFAPPGDWIDNFNQTPYTLHGAVVLYLKTRESESAYSYGVELLRSMGDSNYDTGFNDPIMNEFIARYLVHFGLK